MGKGKKQLTFEDYVQFFDGSWGRRELTIDQLNQIVFMHGFIKLHRWQKVFILEVLDSMELMRPRRSTLGRAPAAVSGPAVAVTLSLEEVKRDIESLRWQECPVGSVVTVGAAPDVETVAAVDVASPSTHLSLSSSATAATTAAASAVKKRKKCNGKRKRISEIAAASPLRLLRPS